MKPNMKNIFYLLMIFTTSIGGVVFNAHAINENTELFRDNSQASKLKMGGNSEKYIYIQQLHDFDLSQNQYLTFKGGRTSYSNLALGNHYNQFIYASTSGPSIAMEYETLPLRFLGRWGFFSELAYTSYVASITPIAGGATTESKIYVLPLSGGLTYHADWSPTIPWVKWMMPFASLGVTYNLLFQSGDGDASRARGSANTLRKAFGIRHSLNWMGLEHTQILGEYSVSSAMDDKHAHLASESIQFGFSSQL